MEIKLWDSFSKRRNSTKAPSEEDVAVTRTAVLKEGCSKTHPSFFIQGIQEYTYVQAFGRYYFVDNVEYDINDAEWLHCSIDFLATWKDKILETSAYIVYSSTGYNRWIRDDRCPIIIKGSEYIATSSAINYAGYSLFEATDNEIVVISTVSKNQGIAHWVTTEQSFSAMIMELMDAGSNIWQSLMTAFGDAMGSIIQVRRMPVTNGAINALAEGPYDVYLGDYGVPDIHGSGELLGLKKLSKTYVSLNGSIGIPVTYTDYRYTEPYCHARISLPFVGVADISLSDLAPSGGINWQMDLDLVTGAISYTLYDSSITKPIASYAGQCGAQVPIANQQITTAQQIVSGVGTSLLTFGIGTMAGNAHMAIGGAGASIMAVANAFYASAHKSTSVVGAYSGNRSEFANRQIRLTVEKFATANEPSNLTELEGRPVCKVDRVGDYSGYVQTQKFSIDIDELQSVRDMINTAMDSGVYLE